MTDTVAHAEAVENSLDAFIEQRDKARRKREGERDEEMAWKESVARYNERHRRQLAWAWLRHHEQQMRRLTSTYEHLIGKHRRALEACEKQLGLDTKEDAA